MLSAGEPLYGLSPGALPTGGQITAGRGTIATSGNQMTVNQSSQQLIANWQSFNIGQNAAVSFNQPSISSSALNRITDQSPSQIMGSLSSNGQVYLLNPSGIIFGKTAQVNVGGLVASSLTMLDSDFLAGKYSFSSPGTAGSIQNQGAINASNGGVVALIASKVTNEGSITANNGSVLLAAGKQVTLDFTGDGLISYTVDQGAVDALAENDGLIKADGGQVVMTAKAADALRTATVTNSGVIEARTLQNKAGHILLLSDMQNGETNVSGTLDASASNCGEGGYIETSGGRVKIADATVVTTAAPQGKAGTWLIDPTDFTISSGSAAQTISGIGATTLSTALGSNNAAIATSSTQTGTNLGDININAPVSWSAHTLTLTAAHNININAVMTAGASSSTTYASLAMNTGTAGSIIAGLNANGSFKGQVNFLNADGTTPRSGTGFLTINSKPYTVITTLTQLQKMTANLIGYYALGSSVNASATALSNFIPIGSSSTMFTGIFDGFGHTINNLTISQPTIDEVGLFGFIGSGSVIRNVRLVSPSVRGGSDVGGLVGWNAGLIDGSSVSWSNVKGSSYVGGLVGYNLGTINGSSVSWSNVKGSSSVDYVGGLVGYNVGGTISGSSVSGGSVSGSGNDVGGLVGYAKGGTIIGSSVIGGNVSGSSYVGGLVGSNTGWISGSSVSWSNVKGIGSGNFIGGLVGYAKGGTISGSSVIGGSVSGYIMIGGLVGFNIGGAIIGSSVTGGSVSGGSYAGGLVGKATGTIIGSSATGGSVSGSSDVGGLVGTNSSGTINGSSVSGGSVSGNGAVGGLVGYGKGGTINGSSAIGNSVSGSGNYVGGLVGYNLGTISGSSATGGSVSGSSDVGGLVGTNSSGTINGSSVSGGSVSGNGAVGGLVGDNSGIISDSYATGSLTGNLSVGGLVGVNYKGTITNSYATGSVSGSSYVGGLVGYSYGDTITNSYASGSVTGSGGNVGGLVGFNNNANITNT